MEPAGRKSVAQSFAYLQVASVECERANMRTGRPQMSASSPYRVCVCVCVRVVELASEPQEANKQIQEAS